MNYRTADDLVKANQQLEAIINKLLDRVQHLHEMVGSCLICGGVRPTSAETAETGAFCDADGCTFDLDHEFVEDEDGICEAGVLCPHNWEFEDE